MDDKACSHSDFWCLNNIYCSFEMQCNFTEKHLIGSKWAQFLHDSHKPSIIFHPDYVERDTDVFYGTYAFTAIKECAINGSNFQRINLDTVDR